MLVRLVRHACAGDKATWEGDDAARPLDPVGVDQARAIGELLGRRPAGRLLSSPTTRCLDTLVPLAQRWEVPIVADDRLAVGADPDDVLALVVGSVDGDVLCTHGEVMEALLPRLDVAARGDALLAKGTVWDLTVEDGHVTRLGHVVPTGARPCGEHRDHFVRI